MHLLFASIWFVVGIGLVVSGSTTGTPGIKSIPLYWFAFGLGVFNLLRWGARRLLARTPQVSRLPRPRARIREDQESRESREDREIMLNPAFDFSETSTVPTAPAEELPEQSRVELQQPANASSTASFVNTANTVNSSTIGTVTNATPSIGLDEARRS